MSSMLVCVTSPFCTASLQDVNLPSISRLEGQPLEVPPAAAEATPAASASGNAAYDTFFSKKHASSYSCNFHTVIFLARL